MARLVLPGVSSALLFCPREILAFEPRRLIERLASETRRLIESLASETRRLIESLAFGLRCVTEHLIEPHTIAIARHLCRCPAQTDLTRREQHPSTSLDRAPLT